MFTRVARFIVPFIFFVSAVASFFSQINGRIQHSSIENDPEKLIVSSTPPKCPLCSSGMVERIGKKGRWAGKKFWGCPNFPGCKGIVQK